MEYKGVQIPDSVDRVARFTLGIIDGDGNDCWELSPKQLNEMLSEADNIAKGKPLQICVSKKCSPKGFQTLVFDAVVSEPECDDMKFDRISEQMGEIDKNNKNF